MKLTPAQQVVLNNIANCLAPNEHIPDDHHGKQAAFASTMKSLRKHGLIDEWDALTPQGYEVVKQS